MSMSKPRTYGFVWLLVAVLGASSGVAQSQSEIEVKIKKKAIFLNQDGEVIEIEGEGDGNTFVWSVNGDAIQLVEGHGPSVFLAQLGLGGGFLGVEMTSLTDALRRHFGAPEGVGVMIAEVVEGSPAQQAGLQVGDIVTRADGKDIVSQRELSAAVRKKAEGELLDLELWREGRVWTLVATIEERKRARFKVGRNGSELMLERLGAVGLGADHVIHLDDALGQMKEYFEGDEWRERVRRIDGLDWNSLAERMQELERQLEELEEQIAESKP